ncbi:MAG: putative DNA binding domain-containing protein [Planctomycetales bacterium]|nr:putative DNA binding domain-containing protein [Planctomycetales bacterium]
MNDRITDDLLTSGESSTVEFKTSSVSNDKVAEVVCSFVNSHGGVLIVGVDDEGNPDHGATLARAEEIESFLQKAISPNVLYDVSLDEVASGSVICVGVPAGPDRPYVFDGRIFVRRGIQTVVATSDELRLLVEESSRDVIRWERRPCAGLDVSDINTQLLHETVRRGRERSGFNFGDEADELSILRKLALVQSGQLTNAADVLFGLEVAQHHPQTRLRAVCYASDKSDDFVDEQLFEGPAFELLEKCVTFLKRNIHVEAVFSGEKLARDSKPRYPFDALREALVNALVHRDYASFSGSVAVSVFPDRIEIWNSGSLPHGLSPRDLTNPSHASVLVNPDIGHVFFLYGLMERVGRGTYKIVRQCMEWGMAGPEWRHANGGVRLTLFAPGKGSSSELNDRQKKLLADMAIGEPFRLQEYVDQFGGGITARQARRDLSQLELMGLIRRLGSGSKTAYEVQKNE